MLVSAERSGRHLEELAGDDDDVVIAAVTAAELLVGVELADARRKRARRAFVEAILSQIPIEIYDLDVARAHSLLLAATHRAGRPRGAHDLIIAGTALARGRSVVTRNTEHFEDLPGVLLRNTG